EHLRETAKPLREGVLDPADPLVADPEWAEMAPIAPMAGANALDQAHRTSLFCFFPSALAKCAQHAARDLTPKPMADGADERRGQFFENVLGSAATDLAVRPTRFARPSRFGGALCLRGLLDLPMELLIGRVAVDGPVVAAGQRALLDRRLPLGRGGRADPRRGWPNEDA